jgi:hypothetical protein
MPYIRRVRRNHGLEHATIHLLNRQHYRLSGRSSEAGFVILGDVPTSKLEAAVHEALHRMRNGEHYLAVHPNCGTNLLTTGFLTTAIGALGFAGSSRARVKDRFSFIMMLMMGAVIFSQPLGMSLQRYFTTEGDPGDLELVSIHRSQMKLPFSKKPVTVHHVLTRSG